MTDDAPMRVGDLARRTGLSDPAGAEAGALAREWHREVGMRPEARASIGRAMTALSD
jgi:AraC-like DNA-binding protein